MDYTALPDGARDGGAVRRYTLETWRVMPDGALRSGQGCLTQSRGRAVLAKCRSTDSQRWRYTLPGNLINRASQLCLTGPTSGQAHRPGLWTQPRLADLVAAQRHDAARRALTSAADMTAVTTPKDETRRRYGQTPD